MKKVLFVFAGLLLTVSVFSQWSLTGNAGTNPAINFIGTTDNQPIIFKVNNQRVGYLGTTNDRNVSFGFSALVNTGSIDNSAFGVSALSKNTTGNWNVAVGAGALMENTSGGTNTAVGTQALEYNTSGYSNVGIGRKAISANISGINNTAVGTDALQKNQGSNNVAIGYNALGNSNYNGSNNIAVGANTNFNSNINITNSIVIGNQSYVSSSNMAIIGNSSTQHIGGIVAWSSSSDRRIKKNIRPDVPGLEFILKLQPVTYTMDLDAVDKIQKANMPQRDETDLDPALARIEKEAREAKEKIVYTGFIAQDVEKAAQSIGYDFSGVDVAKNENDLYGLRYSEFVVPLVKAVQELSEQNESLQNQVEKLTELVNLLLNKEDLSGTRSASVVPDASLEQNYPNPFTSSTTIAYTLPQTFRSAKIVITTLSGQVFRQIPVSGAGAGSIMIKAGELSVGVYSYSLYVDDILVDRKKMVVI